MIKPKLYRDYIDHMVEVCHTGQGSIGPSRARKGIWNANAAPNKLNDQHQINLLLKSLTPAQRELLATMLKDAFVDGVFEAIKGLEEFVIQPFVEGYEGSSYHDFIGRVADDPWPWPKKK